ncbi:MAG: histidine--tRNA ligase [Candidatus Aureabacteria bacterium]|nr:histidine--tRNA ligase [Candidatus Auribacterota bacterium]
MGPIFRYEKPQTGRYRQHHQFGVEAIGIAEPEADAEIIEMILHLYTELGITGLTPVINSVGCKECRPGYTSTLRGYLEARAADLCEDCRRRVVLNPLRVFDCKVPRCGAVIAAAPKVSDNLCPACRSHFEAVCVSLRASGIEYVVRPQLVRGIDYYTRTTFEILSGELGAQNAVGGGGRYNDLVETLGGPPTPAIGFGTGIERVLMIMAERGIPCPGDVKRVVPLVVWERECLVAARVLLAGLRRGNIPAEIDFSLPSIKSQLRRAHRAGAPRVLILGKDEMARNVVKIKQMGEGAEREVALDAVVRELGGAS